MQLSTYCYDDVEVARIAPPPAGWPGSEESGRFAVFQKIVWTGHLDFPKRVYVELALVGLDKSGFFFASSMPIESTDSEDGSVYIDSWSPGVQCYGICLDINWDNFVDEADFMMVIGGCGCSAGGEMACLDGAFSADGYMDSDLADAGFL